MTTREPWGYTGFGDPASRYIHLNKIAEDLLAAAEDAEMICAYISDTPLRPLPDWAAQAMVARDRLRAAIVRARGED